MVGGESPDILLSKEANREQLEIAQRIEDYNAVLVQGPPGTGKTHTIANLLGHFIAQGKSVLVTSYTTKALDVLKEKINPGLQSLCVSLLDDSNKDMEASVDGITNYMSNHTSSGLKREIDDIDAERQNIITGLAKVRKQIFMSLQKECESIIYQGESFTPTEAAKFVALNQDRLDYIPGYVKKDAVLPLTFEELVELYRSNEIITEDDAEELDCDLPSPNDLSTADGFEEICDRISSLNRHIEEINTDPSLKVKISSESTAMQFEIAERKFSVENSSKEAIAKLKSYCEQYKTLTPWQQAVAVDGKAGSGYKNRWLNLVQQIENAQKIGAEFADKGLGMNVSFAEGVFVDDLLEPLKKVKGFYDNGGLPFMFSILHKTCAKALKAVRVSGKVPSSSRECEVVILRIEQIRARQLCAASWKELLQPYCVEDFYSFGAEPEREVQPYVQSIRMYLDWWEKDYQKFTALMENANLPEADVCGISSLDSSTDSLKKLLAAISHIIPICCDACATMFDLLECREKINQQAELLIKGNRVHSDILKGIREAMLQMNAEIYDKELEKLASVYKKRDILSRRDAYLKRLRPYAPDWAEAIHKHKGIHGEAVVRSDIMEAWKWRQLSMLLDEITSTPLREYQSESRRLSKAYRAITAKYAEKCGWYHLLLNTERDRGLQQALQGWRAAIRKVGKGTGKRAPIFKAEARRLMPKCQTAVPVWIMPIYKAMENLDPKKNNFDIVIVDEASQADISSLAILYMGKKLIIVGDDKQVSPMAVGVDTNKMDNLRQMYLSEDIPNSVQYDAQASIYDIALTTYHPLMLREHFRCVPDIIGYSNWLSYDGKILPLRSADSSNLLPAVVNYRVNDGKRNGRQKINKPEGEAIVALLKACIEQPEYAGKTFGVISLLGAEQARWIEMRINQDEGINAQTIEERRILCGDSSNFQGDERDVIFLSMVDSPDDPAAPLTFTGFGVQDSTRKRYNVAASRARDQLWVVHSLDPNVNLKPGDIRKGLIEYALHPREMEYQQKGVKQQADSEFEVQVVMKLKARGYHIVQQWEVGAYRIDMVAVYRDKKIAIECDGDRYHSSPSQVQHDMERQTILERIGWTFIRIRGSEYFSQPEQTIERVVEELNVLGIQPEDEISSEEIKQVTTPLLERVKQRAAMLLHPNDDDEDYPKNDVTDILPVPNDAAGLEQSIDCINNIAPCIPDTDSHYENSVHETSESDCYQNKQTSRSVNQDKPAPTLFPEMEYSQGMTFADVVKILEEHYYDFIDHSQDKSVIWVIAGIAEKPKLRKLIDKNFLIKWYKRGMKQTNNQSFFVIRRDEHAKRKKGVKL